VSARYVHTNLVAADWRALAAFYEDVFGCERVPPERELESAWLDRATGLRGARLTGVHLRLPGHGPDGPTLEIFSYAARVAQTTPTADRLGFGHIAFAVDDVRAALQRVIDAGGSALGDVAEAHVEGAGDLTLVYARDPEDNIIELQKWGRPSRLKRTHYADGRAMVR